MKALPLTALLLLLLCCTGHAQVKLHTEDLPRFYQAFDSVMTTTDTARQLAYIQRLYIDRGSRGLHDFMELRGGNAPKWRQFMQENKADLQAKRPYILSVLDQEAQIRSKLAQYRSYYPHFRDGDIYFCVGINNSGGTIRDQTVYIGTELAATSRPDWALYLVLHEFSHTQQFEQRHYQQIIGNDAFLKKYEATHQNLLGKCISEGMADFAAELVLGQSLAKQSPDGYLAFGAQHEAAIWAAFAQDMNKPYDWNEGWLYNQRTVDGKVMRDLGYFVGYRICQRYYQQARNKKQALAYMLELNLTDENARHFLALSGYGAQPAPSGR